MTMITPSYLGETIEYSSLHACRSTLEDPTSLRDGGWLTPGALLVVEEAKDAAFAAPDGFEELERRVYDDTEFVFLRTGPASS